MALEDLGFVEGGQSLEISERVLLTSLATNLIFNLFGKWKGNANMVPLINATLVLTKSKLGYYLIAYIILDAFCEVLI